MEKHDFSLGDTKILGGPSPLAFHSLHQLHCPGEPVLVRGNDTLEALWVVECLNVSRVVPDQVVVELNAPWLLLLDHDIAHLKEDAFNLGVVVVECLCAVHSSRTLVSLQNEQELLDQFLTLSHQGLLV